MRDAIGCWTLGICLLASWACSDSDSGNDADNRSGSEGGAFGGSGHHSSGESSAAGNDSQGTGGLGRLADSYAGSTGAPEGTAGAADTCVSSSQGAALRPLYLAFLFDVSGSMGALDFPWHDPELKWDPVVAATRAFVEDDDSPNIYASLTLFPIPPDSCNPETYTQFEVPMTALPAPEIGEVFDRIGPDGDGTPTLAAIEGMMQELLPMASSNPEAEYALVLVTDGTPLGCSDATVESVAALVRTVSGVVPTYVIGVENPPIEDAPENVSGLNAIAEAGGTDHAFIIETGDPAQTTRDFRDAVDSIRGETISCAVDIPEPPVGQELNPRRVNVVYSNDEDDTSLHYDPDCADDMTWYYDDPEDPHEIHLCPDTCETIRADGNARLSIEFACEDVIVLI